MATSPSTPSWHQYSKALGLNLQRARATAGLSQERVAHEAGISPYTYQKYEKGESKPGTPMNPQLRNLIRLCQVLDVAVADLLPAASPDLPH